MSDVVKSVLLKLGVEAKDLGKPLDQLKASIDAARNSVASYNTAARSAGQGAGQSSAVSAAAEQLRARSLKEINASLGTQLQQLVRINTELEPNVLRKRVMLTLELERAQKRLNDETARERLRQEGHAGAGRARGGDGASAGGLGMFAEAGLALHGMNEVARIGSDLSAIRGLTNGYRLNEVEGGPLLGVLKTLTEAIKELHHFGQPAIRRQFSSQGFYERDFAIEHPLELRQRDLREQQAARQSALESYRNEGPRAREAWAAGLAREQFGEAVSSSVIRPENYQAVYAEAAGVQRYIREGSKGTAASEQALYQAAQARDRTRTEVQQRSNVVKEDKRNQEFLEKATDLQFKYLDELRARSRGGDKHAKARMPEAEQELQKRYDAEQETIEKRRQNMQQLVEAQERMVAAEARYGEALREHQAAERERLENWRQWASDAQKFYRNQASAEAERLRGTKENFGLANPLEKQGVVQVARKIAAGQGEKLTPEELAFARSHGDIFGDSLKKLGGQMADKGPEWAEVNRLLGLDQRQKEAEKAEKYFADLKVQVENKIQAEIKVNEQSLAEQLTKELVPAIQSAILNITQLIKTELAKAADQAQRNQAALYTR